MLALRQFQQRFCGTAFHRHQRQAINPGQGLNLRCRANAQHSVFIGSGEKLLGVQKQLSRRQYRALGVALCQPEPLLRVLAETGEHRFNVAVHHHHGLLAQVIKHAGGVFKKQRQVVFDAGRCHAVAYVLVQTAAGRVAVQHFAPAAAKQNTRCIVHGKFTPRQQAHFGHRVQAALRIRVKGAYRVDFVIKQIDPVRHQRTHGKQIDEAAAHGVFTRTDDLVHVAVTGQGQLRFQSRFVQLLLDLEVKCVGRQKRRWCQAIQRGGGRHQNHIGVALGNAPQRGQSFADQVLVRRETVIRQGFPVGKQHASSVRREERQFIQQTLGIKGVGGEDGQSATVCEFTVYQRRQQGRIRRTGWFAQVKTFGDG